MKNGTNEGIQAAILIMAREGEGTFEPRAVRHQGHCVVLDICTAPVYKTLGTSTLQAHDHQSSLRTTSEPRIIWRFGESAT